MKSKLFVSTVVLIMAAFSVGGSTVAWFTSQADPLLSTFSAGTVDIEVTGGNVETTVDGDTTIYEVPWTIENTGSKAIYLRARLMDLEWDVNYETEGSPERALSARAGVEELEQGDIFVPYTKGAYTEDSPLVADIRVAEGNQLRDPTGQIIGQMIMWDDGDELVVKIVFTNQLAILDESIVYVGTEATQSSPSYQQWTDHYLVNHDLADRVSEYTYYIDQYAEAFNSDPELSFAGLADGEVIYIALRSEVISLNANISGPSLGEDCEGNWLQGDDGWWYYGTEEGPTLVPAQSGEDSKADICFVVTIEGIDGSASFKLEAETVQASNNAYNFVWVDPDHPWYVPPPNPSLSLTLNADSNSYLWGETIIYTVEVINSGNVTLEGIAVTSEDLDIPEEYKTIASLAPGELVRFTVDYPLEESYTEDPLNITKTVNAATNSLSASASATITVKETPDAFADLSIGDYVEIDGVLFQKIAANLVLLWDVSTPPMGDYNHPDAVELASSYWQDFEAFVIDEGSRLLTRGEIQGLIDDGYQSSIVELGVPWWTSTSLDTNDFYYVTADGTLGFRHRNVGGNDQVWLRPAMELREDLEIQSGSGTAGAPYIIVNPND